MHSLKNSARKIEAQLTSGRKLLSSGKTTGRELDANDRVELGKSLADIKEKLTQFKGRTKRVQQHTSHVGEEIKAHVDTRIKEIVASQQRRPDKPKRKNEALFEGAVVRRNERAYVIEKQYHVKDEQTLGRPNIDYLLLLEEQVRQYNSAVAAHKKDPVNSAAPDVDTKYKECLYVNQTEFKQLSRTVFARHRDVILSVDHELIPAGWCGTLLGKTKTAGQWKVSFLGGIRKQVVTVPEEFLSTDTEGKAAVTNSYPEEFMKGKVARINSKHIETNQGRHGKNSGQILTHALSKHYTWPVCRQRPSNPNYFELACDMFLTGEI